MSAHNLTIFIHISSALILFFAFGIEWAAVSFLGKAQNAEEAGHWLRLAKLAPIVNGPALLVAILSGAYLASLNSAFKQGWVSASFIGIAIVAAIGGAINVPKLRAIRAAIPNGGPSLAAALQTRALPVSVRLRTFTTLAIVFTMVTKPPFGRSLLELFAGLIIGFLLSIPALTRNKAA
ncbi:MAG: hypothetical protein JSS69_00625 [Acidobacteria bacterium]|nr:hypothetical protein [Acidobacteriota bacterium]MBS1864397.1 hypothetical protein [Acidobacteriota bacterium]